MNKLPTINQIIKGELSQNEKDSALNVLLNQEPPSGWLKSHPIAKNVKYISIDKIEYLLTKIFVKWNIEIKEVKVIANSAVVVIRLNYENPISNVMEFQEGVGAAPIHTKSGAGAMDWNAVQTDSVMKAVPAAESYAIKDAAEKIGRIFGKDLNRKNLLPYDNLIDMSKFEGATLTEK